MNNGLKRKEVWLHSDVIGQLEVLAAKKKWSLKQFMEYVLVKESAKYNNSKKKVHG